MLNVPEGFDEAMDLLWFHFDYLANELADEMEECEEEDLDSVLVEEDRAVVKAGIPYLFQELRGHERCEMV